MVELVDLYPTLADLAGLPVDEQLEGKSFAPILDDPQAITKTAALSQSPRGGGLMGYSLRTADHRLTQWVDRQSGDVRDTELYDYAGGLVETQNLADKRTKLVAQLSAQLETAFAIELVAEIVETAASFEEAKPGEFKKLETQVGTWSPETGRTIVDDKHAKNWKAMSATDGWRENERDSTFG